MPANIFRYIGVEGSGKSEFVIGKLYAETKMLIRKINSFKRFVRNYYYSVYGKPTEIYPFPVLKEKKER